MHKIGADQMDETLIVSTICIMSRSGVAVEPRDAALIVVDM
jgi:hypothetical protein